MIRYEWVWRPAPKTLAGIAGLYKAMGSHCFLVARSGGRLVGMGRAISDRVSDGYIQDVFVRPSLRGRGVGAELVRRLALRLRIDGLGWIGLIAADGTWPFYAGLGFRKMRRHDPMRFQA